MTDVDFPTFNETFQHLRRVFPLRGDTDEIAAVVRAYFKALERWPLEAVIAASETWLNKGTRFPKPADWIGAMPHSSSSPVYVPPMSDEEAAEHRRAVAGGYQAAPCQCYLCQQAGVHTRPLRFVPDEDADGNEVPRVLNGHVVAMGHWAHGTELRAWYAAHDKFWAMRKRVKPKTIAAAVKAPQPKTEPVPEPQPEAVADVDASVAALLSE